jgi:SAM-dependent methyltransferase
VSFVVAADAYDRFMGRYSRPLAPVFADWAGVAPGMRVIDVGCGTGALVDELVGRVGPASVAAAEPSAPLLASVRDRHPDLDIRPGVAEDLPFADGAFDAALAQLVVHFMTDPVSGIREMARTTRAGGVVAACVWDLAGGTGPLGVFWNAAKELAPETRDESELAGSREGHLGEIFRGAGLADVEETVLVVAIEHPTFTEWWEPFTLGVGPAGAHVASLDTEQQADLRDRCRQLLPDAPFTVTARAWAARGLAATGSGTAGPSR